MKWLHNFCRCIVTIDEWRIATTIINDKNMRLCHLKLSSAWVYLEERYMRIIWWLIKGERHYYQYIEVLNGKSRLAFIELWVALIKRNHFASVWMFAFSTTLRSNQFSFCKLLSSCASHWKMIQVGFSGFSRFLLSLEIIGNVIQCTRTQKHTHAPTHA